MVVRGAGWARWGYPKPLPGSGFHRSFDMEERFIILLHITLSRAVEAFARGEIDRSDGSTSGARPLEGYSGVLGRWRHRTCDILASMVRRNEVPGFRHRRRII